MKWSSLKQTPILRALRKTYLEGKNLKNGRINEQRQKEVILKIKRLFPVRNVFYSNSHWFIKPHSYFENGYQKIFIITQYENVSKLNLKG